MLNISLRNINKSYQKGKLVIKDMNLEIFDDEFLVLVGPSGCGKTTTLRMIAGLEEITSGSLYMNDKLQNDLDPSTRDLSFVFQNYALLPNLTVYENIEFGLLNLKLSKLRKKELIENISKKLGIYQKLEFYTNQLSGGERQRVALARALVDEKKLVLFDEPLSNLDAVLRSGMRKELILFKKLFNVTAIYVTHDQVEAMSMASRIVLLMDGRIIQIGTPYQLYNDPVHLISATFIGTPESNVFYGFYDGFDLSTDKFKLNINEESKELLKSHIASNIYFVVRPQDIHVYHEKNELLLTAKFIFEENFGDSKLLYLDYLGQTIKVLVDKDFIVNESLYIDLNTHVYLFSQDQKRIYKNIIHEIELIDVVLEEKVYRALNDYGYTIVNQLSHKNGYVLKRSNEGYVLSFLDKDMLLKHQKDIFNYLSYIKS